MDFMEFHSYVKQDDILYYFIKKNVAGEKMVRDPGAIIDIDKNKIMLVDKGILVQGTDAKMQDVFRYFFDKHFVSSPAIEETQFECLTCVKGILFDASIVIETLEQENMLSNFFLHLLENEQRSVQRQFELSTYSAKERIIMMLQELSEQKEKFTEPIKITQLARLAHCSVLTTSKVINQLAAERLKNGEDVSLKKKILKLICQ